MINKYKNDIYKFLQDPKSTLTQLNSLLGMYEKNLDIKRNKDKLNNKRIISFHMQKPEYFFKLGATVIFIGFAVLFIGVFFTMLQNPENAQMGGLIMIGPIPIAFGSSPEITKSMLGIGLLIMIIYLFLWRTKR